MTKLREIYKCEICGNVIEVLYEGAPALVCCDAPMTRLEAKTEDQGQEKHVPVVESTDKGVKVKIGEVPHPMEEKHYIKLVEVLTASDVYRHEFKPGDTPEAEFCLKEEDIVETREYCNVHGLWKK
jgi:superoxide reductase